MRKLYTSDTHFSHLRILEYQPNRKYANVEEMNRDLIARWNARVTPDDIVYHLGDFAMGDYSLAPGIFQQLNGKEKHLIFGNHDRKPERMLDMGWTTVQKEITFTTPDGLQIFMCHYPKTYAELNERKVSYQLCGHVHSKWRRARTELRATKDLQHDEYVHGTRDPEGRILNAGVDVNDLQPKTLAELFEDPRA